MIVVEPIPGMKRANEKTSVATLRTDPDAPPYFSVGLKGRRLKTRNDPAPTRED